MFLTLHTFSNTLVTILAPLIVFLMLSWQFQVRHKPGDIFFREPFKKHFTHKKGVIKKKKLKKVIALGKTPLTTTITGASRLLLTPTGTLRTP